MIVYASPCSPSQHNLFPSFWAMASAWIISFIISSQWKFLFQKQILVFHLPNDALHHSFFRKLSIHPKAVLLKTIVLADKAFKIIIIIST